MAVYFGDPYGTRSRIRASSIFLDLPQSAPIQHLVKNEIWQIAADNGGLRGTFFCAFWRFSGSPWRQGSSEETPWQPVKLRPPVGRVSWSTPDRLDSEESDSLMLPGSEPIPCSVWARLAPLAFAPVDGRSKPAHLLDLDAADNSGTPGDASSV